MKITQSIDNFLNKHGNLMLLIEIVIFIFFIPFVPIEWHTIFSNIFFSFIFFTAIFALETSRKIMLTIAVIAFITEWISPLLNFSALHYFSLLINILFFQIIVVKMIIQVAKSSKADAHIILESINGYLMMGLMFTTWVGVAMFYDPTSFSFNVDNPMARDFTYFTFVTITTLGYGEITPNLPFAKSISILISTAGQIYVAVIIAMLVGKYASQKN